MAQIALLQLHSCNSGADPGFCKGGSFIINVRAKFLKPHPLFSLTAPIFDRRPRVRSCQSHLTVGSRPEMLRNTPR